MPRSVKVVFAAIVLIVIAAFAASCGSSNADFRIFNAIATSPQNIQGSAFDIWLNGSLLYSNLTYGGVQPSTGYRSVSGGSDTVEVFQTGTSTNPYITSALNLGGSNTYTVVLGGITQTSGNGAYAASLLTDTLNAPTTGNANIRIVNAAPISSQAVGGGLDFFILPPGTTPNGDPGVSPQVSNLTASITNNQLVNASPYNAVSTSGALNVYVTAHNSRTPIGNYAPLSGLTAGTSIRTVVFTDSAGASYPPVPYPLVDVQ